MCLICHSHRLQCPEAPHRETPSFPDKLSAGFDCIFQQEVDYDGADMHSSGENYSCFVWGSICAKNKMISDTISFYFSILFILCLFKWKKNISTTTSVIVFLCAFLVLLILKRRLWIKCAYLSSHWSVLVWKLSLPAAYWVPNMSGPATFLDFKIWPSWICN